MSTVYRYLLDPQFIVMVLAAIAAFATVTSFVLPLLKRRPARLAHEVCCRRA